MLSKLPNLVECSEVLTCFFQQIPSNLEMDRHIIKTKVSEKRGTFNDFIHVTFNLFGCSYPIKILVYKMSLKREYLICWSFGGRQLEKAFM